MKNDRQECTGTSPPRVPATHPRPRHSLWLGTGLVSVLVAAVVSIMLWSTQRDVPPTIGAPTGTRLLAGDDEQRPRKALTADPGVIPHVTTPTTPRPSTGHQKMVALLEKIAKRTDADDEFLGDGKVRKLKELMKRLPADAPAKIK